MRLWRVSRRGSFDGEGARSRGGRWNDPGTAVIYAAASLALALLEFVIRVEHRVEPIALFVHSVDVPDDVKIETIPNDGLPSDWRKYPHPASLREIGTRWVRSGATVLLSVPSALLPVDPSVVVSERNYLIHPGHSDFRRLRVRSLHVDLDPRMWR